MGEQQRLLREQRHAAAVRGDERAGAGIGEDHVTKTDAAEVGPEKSGEKPQQRGLADAVRAEHRQHPALVDGEIDVHAARCQPRLNPQVAHHGPDRRRLAVAITIAVATTMSNNDRATAASASVSRCR